VNKSQDIKNSIVNIEDMTKNSKDGINNTSKATENVINKISNIVENFDNISHSSKEVHQVGLNNKEQIEFLQNEIAKVKNN
jgi:methyl-accepting chemotaxis protein